MQTSRFLSVILAVALIASLAFTLNLNAADRPNILLFTADDLHAESLGVYGGKPADLTPNLDAFAAESLLFNRAHVNVPICAPCRAVIATGRYSHRSGAMGFMSAREDVPDIVTTLKAGGYYTGILGKYGHSTPKNSMKWDYHFDQKELGNGRSPKLYKQRSEVFFKQAKEAGKPFYFMVNSHDPHRPYLNSTRRLDDTFGATMQALKDAGVADNTLVLFITDNGIAVPFAKCNTWFHSSHSPLLVRWPDVVKPGTRDDTHFVSVVDFFPTFLEATEVKGPDGLDGRSFLPLLKGQNQKGRSHVFTAIDSKAGGEYVPMRAVQNANYGYIYNPFSDGTYWYRNNNEGKTMAAMNIAAKNDPAIAARIDLFRHRVPEEFYDLENDPNCLNNLIEDPKHTDTLKALQARLVAQMKKTQDPMLPAFQNRNDRAKVDEIMVETYGPRKAKKPRKGRQNKSRKNANKDK